MVIIVSCRVAIVTVRADPRGNIMLSERRFEQLAKELAGIAGFPCDVIRNGNGIRVWFDDSIQSELGSYRLFEHYNYGTGHLDIDRGYAADTERYYFDVRAPEEIS